MPPENSDCTCDLSQWYHTSTNKGIPDDILAHGWEKSKNVSFVFHHRSAQKVVEPEPEVKKKQKEKKIIYDEDDVIDIESDDDDDDEDYNGE